MVQTETMGEVTKISIRLSAAAAVLGIGLLYVYIALTDVSVETKVLWASVLSLGVALVSIIIWTMARDAMVAAEIEQRQRGKT
jgi:hypothetical protein